MGKTRLGVGIVGMGGFGHFLLNEWSKMDEIQVVAVSDEDPTRAPKKLGELKFYQEYVDMLDDPAVDIVSIATPPSSHVPMAILAMERGKHVLVEKPLALTEADARRVADAASRAGVVATVNFILRFDPLIEGIRRVVQSGAFGQPKRIDLRNYATEDTVQPDHWFWDQKISGGIMVEHGVHFFDLSSYILDACAKEAIGMSAWRDEGHEDRVFAAVRFDNDVIGTYWHSFSRPKEIETTTMHLALDLGEIEISGWIPLSASFFGWTNDKGVAVLREALPEVELKVQPLDSTQARASERLYPVTASVRGSATLSSPKIEVYGDLARAMMSDVVAAIRDRNHELRVTLDDAIAAVAIAEKAATAMHEEGCGKQ